MMKIDNKQIKVIIVAVGVVLIILYSAIYFYSKAIEDMNISAKDFSGTFLYKDQSKEQYISILNNNESSYYDPYIIYNNDKKISEGMCLKTDNNYAVLFSKDKKVNEVIIFNSRQYYLASGKKNNTEISKISDEAIIPSTITE
ncbi:MAG: hypothetical protein ACRCUS_01910 [Anaerovoracaceae bacterium]